MASNELNKIAGAILGTLTFVALSSFGAELLFKEGKQKPGYEVAMANAASAPAAAAATAPAAEPIAVRLASADVGRGQAAFGQCASCHTPDKGGANRTGPNMWNVVERVKGQVVGFGYSAALKAIAGKNEKWTYDALDKFIESPRTYMPGTSMGYAGMSNANRRADLIAYLRTLNDTPPPLPTQ
jgi:cytochrome c